MHIPFTIKKTPQDFIVQEQLTDQRVVQNQGRYALVKVTRSGMTTFQVVNQLSKLYHCPKNHIAYAGIKDRHAVATQYFSILTQRQPPATPHLEILPIGRINQPLAIGLLKANQFIITIRDLPSPLMQIEGFPNYFGEQRFSTHNITIGRHLLTGSYDKAYDLLYQTGHKELFDTYQQKNPNNIIGALQILPPKLLTLFIGAYQSKIFNDLLYQDIIDHDTHALTIHESFGSLAFGTCQQEQLPLVGFMTSSSSADTILQKDGLNSRSFIMKQIPHAASPGSMRSTWVSLQNLTMGPYENQTQKVSFTLPKGSYATIALRAMYIAGHIPNQ